MHLYLLPTGCTDLSVLITHLELLLGLPKSKLSLCGLRQRLCLPLWYSRYLATRLCVRHCGFLLSTRYRSPVYLTGPQRSQPPIGWSTRWPVDTSILMSSHCFAVVYLRQATDQLNLSVGKSNRCVMPHSICDRHENSNNKYQRW